MLTDLQKKTCKAIVSLFETGRIKGNPGAIARAKGDTGGISYGAHQASLTSGSLYALLSDYIDTASSDKADLLKPFINRVRLKDLTLNNDEKFVAVLRTLGSDPHMADCQEAYFDREYWQPTATLCKSFKLVLPLTYAVVYDSKIHGSFQRIEGKIEQVIPAAGGDEQEWTTAYVKARKHWLQTHTNELLRKTIYRMDTFLALIAANNWNLDLPLIARGIQITKDSLE